MASPSTPSTAPHHHNDKNVLAKLPMLTIYSDGSFDRHSVPETPASSHFVNGVATKDVVLDSSTGVWARFFLPELVANESTKVPVVLHFHGGGFCIGSPSAPDIHEYYSRIAVSSRCIWVSVNYRLAPENPLPAAYDDAYAALLWLQSQASAAQGDASGTEPWLAQHVDFSKCFLAGESAGATIVHFLAAKAAGRDWSPVRIQGLILLHPGFIKGKLDESGTQAYLSEFYHRAALPPGAEWGHPWSNPLHPDSPKLSDIDLPPLFVAVAEKDGMRDAGVEYYEVLKQAGRKAQLFESPGQGHCFHIFEQGSAAGEVLEKQIVEFIEKFS